VTEARARDWRAPSQCAALERSVLEGAAGGSRGTGIRHLVAETRSIAMTSTAESGNITGTKDKDYDLIWYVEACLDNALRLDIYIQDAERAGDSELTDLFRRAQADSRKGAEMGKQLLARRLAG
jgi:hypothetical protein